MTPSSAVAVQICDLGAPFSRRLARVSIPAEKDASIVGLSLPMVLSILTNGHCPLATVIGLRPALPLASQLQQSAIAPREAKWRPSCPMQMAVGFNSSGRGLSNSPFCE